MPKLVISPIAAAALFALGLVTASHADPLPTSTLGWAVNGIVSEVVRAGDTAYVGGSFNSVAPSTNLVFNVAAFSVDSAAPVLPRLDINGRVRAVVALAGGGWILGGEFTLVDGVIKNRLVKLRADGSVDPAFSASVNGTVWTLLSSGSRVFVGGAFSSVNNTSVQRLVALDATTGALDNAFTPSVSGGSATVYALAVSGTQLVVGGAFTTVNGGSHANLAAVDAATGATVGAFTGTADGKVAALATSGASLYAAGAFQTIGGLSRRGVAKLDAATGAADAAFNGQANGDVNGMALSSASLFVGGTFGQIGGASRAKIAELDATTGAATTWNPGADAEVEQVVLAGGRLIVGGHFQTIAGVERLRLAALATTGTTDVALSWNPSLDSSVDLVYADAAGTIFAGGSFNYFGAVPRRNAAAFDLKVGSLLPWDPSPDGWVRALDIYDHTVFIGGDFMNISGVTRHFVASIDAVTGVASSWHPKPDQRINGLQVLGTTVYFVGDFGYLGTNTTRGHGAASTVDGTLLTWDPQANDNIESLFAVGARVYIGGAFSTVGGTSRARLAAVDATTGAVVSGFAPTVSGSTPIVYRVDVLGDMVFFGGRFSMVNGSTRNNAAAVKGAPGAMDDGSLLGWHPDVSGEIYDLDAYDDDVYLAGGFGAVGGSSRPGIAMVDALPTGGAVRSWKPTDVAGGSVSVIDASSDAVLFGGLLYDLNYLYIGAVLYPEAGLAGVPPQPTTPRARVTGSTITLDWGAPSLGARPTSYIIEAGSAPGLSNLARANTGSSATTISGAGLGPGTYYYRLRSVGSAGFSAATEDQAFVIGGTGCVSPPAAPTDLQYTTSGSNVTLTWRAPAASVVTSYRMTAGTTSGGRELGTFDVGPATSFSVAVPTGAFFLTVRAVNGCGMGPSSAEAALVVGTPVVPPGAPFALEATQAAGTVTFTWAAPSVGSGPFSYRLEAGTAPGLSNLASLPVNATSFAVAGVPSGVYYLRVRAVGPGGTGPAGNELTLIVP